MTGMAGAGTIRIPRIRIHRVLSRAAAVFFVREVGSTVHTIIVLPTETAASLKTEILYRDFAVFGRNSRFISKEEVTMKGVYSLRNLISVLLVVFFVSSSAAQMTAIKSGKILDPASGTLRSNEIILVEGTEIKAVGANLRLPSGVKVVDLSDMIVLPGLIDTHTHLCNTFDARGDVGNELLLYTLIASTTDRAFQGVVNARSMLESGFTTVRDMGNAGNYADVALKRAIEEGIISGPTLFVSGKIIAPFGGQFVLDPEFPDIGKQDYLYADSREELRKAIRQNIHFGVDWIKIVVDDYPYIYSTDDIRFIVDEAARAGLKVAAHCVTEQGARNAAEAGLASIEHGFEMSDEVLTLAKKNGIVLCATDFTQEIMELYNFFTVSHAEIVDRLKRAYRIGIPIAFGSDVISNVPGHTRGSAALSLLDTWVEAEIPPKEIMHALTIHGAKLLGIENERGAIKAGMKADIIATPVNPLDDIHTLKQVIFVMKDGQVIVYRK